MRPTPLAGERLRPLGHLSGAPRWIKKTSGTINKNGERIAIAAAAKEEKLDRATRDWGGLMQDIPSLDAPKTANRGTSFPLWPMVSELWRPGW